MSILKKILFTLGVTIIVMLLMYVFPEVLYALQEIIYIIRDTFSSLK